MNDAESANDMDVDGAASIAEDSVAGVPVPVESFPTIAEARVMFSENPGLACVLTDAGFLNRDGTFAPSVPTT